MMAEKPGEPGDTLPKDPLGATEQLSEIKRLEKLGDARDYREAVAQQLPRSLQQVLYLFPSFPCTKQTLKLIKKKKNPRNDRLYILSPSIPCTKQTL